MIEKKRDKDDDLQVFQEYVCGMCESELCLLRVVRRVFSEDRPVPGQSQAVSFLRPVLLWLLSPRWHHHHPFTHGAQLGPHTARGRCNTCRSLYKYVHLYRYWRCCQILRWYSGETSSKSVIPKDLCYITDDLKVNCSDISLSTGVWERKVV